MKLFVLSLACSSCYFFPLFFKFKKPSQWFLRLIKFFFTKKVSSPLKLSSVFITILVFFWSAFAAFSIQLCSNHKIWDQYQHHVLMTFFVRNVFVQVVFRIFWPSCSHICFSTFSPIFLNIEVQKTFRWGQLSHVMRKMSSNSKYKFTWLVFNFLIRTKSRFYLISKSITQSISCSRSMKLQFMFLVLMWFCSIV